MKLWIDKFKALDRKIKIAGIIFIAATIFVLMPSSSPKNERVKNNSDIEILKKETEKELNIKLSKITGVDKAEIVITYLNDGFYEYQTDDKSSIRNDDDDGKKTSLQTQIEKKTVFDGGKNTIVKSRRMPEIKGVCIFYSGNEDEKTKLNLYNAAKGSLGIELYKIEVIHVKG